jgi:N6-adenosine-specific RNA methylase IME4
VGLVTLPAGPFDVIVVDPPWSYGSTNDRSSAGKHYRTLQASTRGKNTRPAVEELVQQRLDVFARRPRLGWQAWGDEVPAPTIGRSEKEEG